MSRRCEICGKGPQSGNKVSKSYNHTRRLWKPNIIEVKTEINGTTMTIKMCTRCLRSGYVTKKVSVPKQAHAQA
ncbi:MAG: 50S ribosomal protein L28 [Treponemataceae bacterium]